MVFSGKGTRRIIGFGWPGEGGEGAMTAWEDIGSPGFLAISENDIGLLSSPLGFSCLGLLTTYDEVWVLPYMPVHQEGQNQPNNTFIEIWKTI